MNEKLTYGIQTGEQGTNTKTFNNKNLRLQHFKNCEQLPAKHKQYFKFLRTYGET
jgi:hypothetical protein